MASCWLGSRLRRGKRRLRHKLKAAASYAVMSALGRLSASVTVQKPDCRLLRVGLGCLANPAELPLLSLARLRCFVGPCPGQCCCFFSVSCQLPAGCQELIHRSCATRSFGIVNMLATATANSCLVPLVEVAKSGACSAATVIQAAVRLDPAHLPGALELFQHPSEEPLQHCQALCIAPCVQRPSNTAGNALAAYPTCQHAFKEPTNYYKLQL